MQVLLSWGRDLGRLLMLAGCKAAGKAVGRAMGRLLCGCCWLLVEGHGPGLLVLVWCWNLGGVLMGAATNLDGTGAGAETAAARLSRAAGCVAE